MSLVCTKCGMELEQSEVSFSLEHMDKDYSGSRQQIRDTSSALAFIGTNKGGHRPLSDRQQLYRVRKGRKFWQEGQKKICSPSLALLSVPYKF